MKNQALKPSVGDEQVAPSAEYEQGDLLASRPARCFNDIGLRLCLDEPLRGSADPEGRERRKLNISLDVH